MKMFAAWCTTLKQSLQLCIFSRVNLVVVAKFYRYLFLSLYGTEQLNRPTSFNRTQIFDCYDRTIKCWDGDWITPWVAHSYHGNRKRASTLPICCGPQEVLICYGATFGLCSFGIQPATGWFKFLKYSLLFVFCFLVEINNKLTENEWIV